MSRKSVKTKATASGVGVRPQTDSYAQPQPFCPTCSAKEGQLSMQNGMIAMLQEQVVFLREQTKKLQDQVISLVPNAADQYTRMTLSQMSASTRGSGAGINSMRDVLPDDEVDMDVLDQAHRQIMKDFSN